jgi:hypothetical protein
MQRRSTLLRDCSSDIDTMDYILGRGSTQRCFRELATCQSTIDFYDLRFVQFLFTIRHLRYSGFNPDAHLSVLYRTKPDVRNYTFCASLRETITSRAEKAHSLKDSGKGLMIVTNERVSGGLVSADGVIVVTSDKPPGFVVLRPRLEDGVVKWICGGLPEKNLPGSCRTPIF